jgi:hypothetical protein
MPANIPIAITKHATRRARQHFRQPDVSTARRWLERTFQAATFHSHTDNATRWVHRDAILVTRHERGTEVIVTCHGEQYHTEQRNGQRARVNARMMKQGRYGTRKRRLIDWPCQHEETYEDEFGERYA